MSRYICDEDIQLAKLMLEDLPENERDAIQENGLPSTTIIRMFTKSGFTYEQAHYIVQLATTHLGRRI